MEGFLTGDGNTSSPGAVGPQRWRERRPSPRAGSMSLSQLATRHLGWGFHTLRGGIDPGDLRFCPRGVGGFMRPYPPRVWRDIDVVPRGNSRRARAP